MTNEINHYSLINSQLSFKKMDHGSWAIRFPLKSAVGDIAADHRQNRSNLLQAFIWNREIVVTEHYHVRELTGFYGSNPVFFMQKPSIVCGVQFQNFLPRDLLVRIDWNLAGVQSCCRVVHVQPWVHRCDLHAVGTHARVDAIVYDHAKRWTILLGCSGQITPARERQSATQCF